MDLSFLHPELIPEVLPKLKVGDYDGAIYDATTYIEAKLQETGQTKSINTMLAKEVFDSDQIKISSRSDKNVGAQMLFDGMFRLIRNDRGHRKSIATKTEIKCDNEPDCLKYLGFLSLLLLYLEHNLNSSPIIETHNINQNVELIGDNFDENCRVLVDGDEIETISISPTRIVIPLPKEDRGTIQIESKYLKSNSIDYLVPKKRKDGIQKIVATNIDLFSDKEATVKIDGIKAVKYLIVESNREIFRVSPTKEKYAVGDYIVPLINIGAGSCGEAWYKDPLSGGTIKYAWTSSSLYKGKIVGRAGDLKPSSLRIRPNKILAKPGEVRTLRAVVTESDGIGLIERDISELGECKWSIDDEGVAYVNDDGVLQTKKFGKTKLTCKYKGIHHEIEIEIATPTSGTKVKFFSSELTKYQQICFDSEDNLYVTNQSPTLYRINKSGGIEKVVVIPQYNHPKYGLNDMVPNIDRITIDLNDEAYINCSDPRAIYKVKGNSLNQILESNKPLKGIAVDSHGIIYVGDMYDEIIRVLTTGESEVLPIQNHSVDIRLLDDNKIIVGSAGGGDAINIYSTKDGSLIRSIKHPDISGVTDIAVRDGEVYVALFHKGEIFKLDLSGDNHTKIADGLGIPYGIDFDSDGNLYISVFDAPNQENVCIYKIYM